MSTLHLVNRPYPASDALASCLAHCQDGDTLLLIEDGVYSAAASQWANLEGHAAITLTVLNSDVEARGLTERLAPAFARIDFDDFVALVTRHQPIVTWF
jgi:tRNA 2-thiouridine synthesizing protein B